MNTPVISIVMSVYNGEKYLPDTVSSILSQTVTDFEFIIINDGSTDRSREILESYDDDRIVLLQQKHTGLTKSLNQGLSLARGEYIARIDADDLAKPERLEMQLHYLRNNPKVILLGSNCYNINEDGSLLSITDLPVDEVQIKWNLLFHNCLRHSTVMFRRKEVDSLGGYNTTIPYAQDYDLWLRIAGKYSVANLKEPLVYLRVPREGAISYDKIDEQTQQAERIYLNVLRTLDSEITGRENEVIGLNKYIFSDGDLVDIDRGEKLFNSIYSAFCNSSFTVNFSKDSLNRIMHAPYVKFAWSYYNQGDLDKFYRCVTKVMDSGFSDPFDIPADDLYQKEKLLFKSLNNYFRANTPNVVTDARKKTFLSRQYTHLAWHYYAVGEMGEFRRCLYMSFRYHPSIKGALLLLKSLLGRRTIEGMSRLKLMFENDYK